MSRTIPISHQSGLGVTREIIYCPCRKNQRSNTSFALRRPSVRNQPPRAEQHALEWFLFTSIQLNDFEDATGVIAAYLRR